MKVNKKNGQILLKEEYLSVIFLSVLYNNTNSETADKVKRVCIILHWWAIGDSNPGPTGYEPVALTN